MKKTRLTLWGLAALLACLVVASPSRAKSLLQPALQDQDQSATANQDQDRDRDAVRPEIANFDVFLDGHPEIAQQLRANPNLVNNDEFVENHPELRDYLKDHPNVREDLKENPRAFMNGERRFDRQEDRRPDRDMTRGELSNFDAFLDNHPKIDRELSKNPSLINNEEYVQNHPELQQFLKNHPGVRDELKENPKAFMSAERRLDNRTDNQPRPRLEPAPDKH